MKQRGDMELADTELADTGLATTGQLIEGRTDLAEHDLGEHGAGEYGTATQDQADLDAALARTLRRFIAEVSRADQPQDSSEAGQKRAHPLREQGKRAAHKLWGR